MKYQTQNLVNSEITTTNSKYHATHEALPVFLSARGVRELTGLSESTIRRLRHSGDFPKPIRLTPSAVGHLRWALEDVLNWINDCRSE